MTSLYKSPILSKAFYNIMETGIILDAGQGITLRQFNISDAVPLFNLIDQNRLHLSQFGDNTSSIYPTLESVERGINCPIDPRKIRFGIWRDGWLMGTVNLRPLSEIEAEIEYWVGRQFCGKGVAKRSVSATTSDGLTKFRVIVGKVHRDNFPSQHVLAANGFKFKDYSQVYIWYQKTAPRRGFWPFNLLRAP